MAPPSGRDGHKHRSTGPAAGGCSEARDNGSSGGKGSGGEA